MARVGVIAALALTACGGPGALAPDLLEPAKPGEAFDGQQCSAVRPPTEPDLMAWDAGSRLNLKSQGEQGVVAVRYEAKGCNVELEVLNCVGEGNYRFSPYKANESKLAKSSRDLYTELPLGAARLGGKVGGGRALRADYMLAGILSLPPMQSFDPASLTGDCERATHVVGRLYLGGFAMASGLSEELSSGASVFSAGAGGNQQRSAERLSEEGDASACAKAQDEARQDPLCSVPLRVGLVPITGRSAGAATTERGSTTPNEAAATSAAKPGDSGQAAPRGPSIDPSWSKRASQPLGVVEVGGLKLLDMGKALSAEVRAREERVNPSAALNYGDLAERAKAAAGAGQQELSTTYWVASLAGSARHAGFVQDATRPLMAAGRIDLVLAVFQNELPKHGDFNVFDHYAELARGLGKPEVARSAADTLLLRDPDQAVAVATAAGIHHALGDTAKACELYMRALDVARDLAYVQLRGYREVGSCDLKLAHTKLEALKKRNPNDHRVDAELGEIAKLLGR